MRVKMLVALCLRVLARFPASLPRPAHRIHPSPALLDALQPGAADPCLWAALAQLAHPLPPGLHDIAVPLRHPALVLLHGIPPSPDFALLTLLALPNCPQLRDDALRGLSLPRLLALDLRGCAISARALDDTAACALRLLSLHGCPNIDDRVLLVLQRFPLLSAIDLRFTRCTPSAVDASLSSFRPSDNKTLFHPAPLSLAVCTLEKIALSAPEPISLYSCPPESVFRVHIDQLGHSPSRPNKATPLATSASIRTLSSAEHTVVFMPPLRKQAKSEPIPSVSASPVPVPPVDQPTSASSVSLFYEDAPAQNRSRKSILPLSAHAVQSSNGAKLDPLAIARLPPPWKTYPPLGSCSDNANSRRPQPAPDSTLKVDRTRLHKRDSDAVEDMVRQFTRKRPKIESEFALAKSRTSLSKLRNPFTTIRSVFAQSVDGLRPSTPESLNERPDMQLQPCHSFPPSSVHHQGTARSVKPLKPITTLKPPILPKELLPPTPRLASKSKTNLRQTRLSFAHEACDTDGAGD